MHSFRPFSICWDWQSWQFTVRDELNLNKQLKLAAHYLHYLHD